MKYSKKIRDEIYNLIASDSYTITEICSIVGISRNTYYDWLQKYPEFEKAISDAEDDYKELIKVEAKKSLVKLIKGYTVQEKKTVTADTGKKDEEGKPIVRVKEETVTNKHYQPNITAVITALTNLDPENWKNRHSQEVTSTVSLKSELDGLSDEELQQIIDGEM
ncbi:MAG: phBC6A51 family helix-turn-helix protein [Petrimonas sp.]|jgi:transposase-like protein